MYYVVERDFHFSAAHLLPGHHKCGRMHGHNWKVTIAVTGPLGNNGMVIDFGRMKEIVNPIIKRLYDHQVINDRVEVPTAENLAKSIHDVLRIYFDIMWIRVEENRDSRATYFPPRTYKKEDQSTDGRQDHSDGPGSPTSKDSEVYQEDLGSTELEGTSLQGDTGESGKIIGGLYEPGGSFSYKLPLGAKRGDDNDKKVCDLGLLPSSPPTSEVHSEDRICTREESPRFEQACEDCGLCDEDDADPGGGP